MLVIENCNSLSDLRQKLIDGEEVRTARQEPCEDVISRDMALEKMADYVASGYADSVEDFEEYSRIICQLPPVNPQEPTTKNDLYVTPQEPCEDAISRVEALKIATTEYELKKIRELPSVNPTKTGHWIPVSEELPDKEGYYLCSVRYMYPPYNFFEPEKVKYMDDVTIQKFDGEFNIEVKAWMSLPEPYKAERSGEE